MTRTLSHSEIAKATTCEAQWDFAYGGQLAGDALKPRTTSPHLRDGRAWGRAVAAYHESDSLIDAYEALDTSLEEDAVEQREAGAYNREVHIEASSFLRALMRHYSETTEPLPITRPEHELNVSIPSRNGGRASTVYRFQAFLDGLHEDDDGRLWIVEYKLRTQLTAVEQLHRDRQIRRYAWAAARALDIDPVGVIVDERLKEAPKAPRILKSGKPSHAKDQLCTAEAYAAVCRQHGVEIDRETFDSLSARRWQQREPIRFYEGELEEVGRELVSAGQLIRDLDSGRRAPIRNSSNANCRGCQFREICAQPSDFLIDMSFTRTVPKRLRPELASPGSESTGGATDGPGDPESSREPGNPGLSITSDPELEEVPF